MDPLTLLGPSLFLSIIASLPFQDVLRAERVCGKWRQLIHDHARGVWRPACYRSGVERDIIAQQEATERKQQPSGPLSPAVGSSAQSDDKEQAGVDWRKVCKTHVERERNWRFGRSRERWITPENNTVWRIKVDHEEGTLISTSRLAGLLVSDLASSEPLFQLDEVQPWAHLEFAKGFVVFNHTHHGNDDGLHVYRTQPCIARSSHPTPGIRNRPPGAQLGHSYIDGVDMREHTGDLPRGHLAFFRRIMPPTDCIAFRARLDHEGTERERAVLGTAGPEAVYIWDLEDAGQVEKIDILPENECPIRYIEFDEDYVFLCSPEQMHVYSRKTRERVMAFPQIGSLQEACSITLNFRPSASTQAFRVPPLALREGSTPTPTTILIARAEESGEPFRQLRALVRATRSPPTPMFSACHFTGRDLWCVTNAGIVLVIRDYREVFATKEAERSSALLARTIGLVFGLWDLHGGHQLTTYRDRVAFSVGDQVYFLDESDLPEMPFERSQNSTALPETTIHRINSTRPQGVRESGCLQMDRSHIYLAYCAFGEFIRDPVNHDIITPPEEATGGFSCCVRVWDFTP